MPAVLLALGTIAVGLEGVIQDNTYFILSSALLLLGGSWAGFAILRLSDAEFAAGRATVPAVDHHDGAPDRMPDRLDGDCDDQADLMR